MNRPRVVSGMRPTGKLHLGHLVGALTNWVALQEQYDCFYFVADWHALTSEYADTSNITAYALDNIADWLAAGVDPERSTIFIQSLVPEHAELFLLLSMVVPIPWLERVPTYKEQQEQLSEKDLSTVGFLSYPLLQTAEVEELKARYRAGKVGDVEVKTKLAAAMNAMLEPMRERRRAVMARPDRLRDIAVEGSRNARVIAQATMERVRDAVKLRY